MKLINKVYAADIFESEPDSNFPTTACFYDRDNYRVTTFEFHCLNNVNSFATSGVPTSTQLFSEVCYKTPSNLEVCYNSLQATIGISIFAIWFLTFTAFCIYIFRKL